MSVEERTGPSNGMWLCSNCHDTIDRDTETYPTEVLKKMKKDAEDRIRKEFFQPVRDYHNHNYDGTQFSFARFLTLPVS